MRVLIVGGGITGLSLARKLADSAQCLIVEGESDLGGKILTYREDGYVVEAGPDSFLTTKPAAEQLCQSLGLGDQLIDTRPEFNQTFIVRDGKLHPIPGGMASFTPTQWGPFLSTRLLSPFGKLRMGMEYFLPRRTNDKDEAMGDFFIRRLGEEAYSWLVEPLLAGIYAGDGRTLSLQSTFPRFLAMEREQGGLMKASLAAMRAAAASPPPSTSLFRTTRGGLVELVAALERDLRRQKVEIVTGTTVQRLTLSPTRAYLSNGQTWEGDAVALCVPAFAAANLLTSVCRPLADQLQEIPYCSSATVSMAYSEQDLCGPPNGYGFVVPRKESRPLMACTWSSSKWPNRAPASTVLLRCYLGGSGKDEILRKSDADLVKLASHQLLQLMGLQNPPQRTWVTRWDRSLPQYLVGHAQRVADIERLTRGLPGLVLAGSAYRGVGLPDCIADGERAAEAIRSQPVNN